MFRYFARRIRSAATDRAAPVGLPHFDVGEVVVSTSAAKLLKRNNVNLQILLESHVRGDNGDQIDSEYTADDPDGFSSQWRLDSGTLWISTHQNFVGCSTTTTLVTTLEEYLYES